MNGVLCIGDDTVSIQLYRRNPEALCVLLARFRQPRGKLIANCYRAP